jgi:hypothetical protein
MRSVIQVEGPKCLLDPCVAPGQVSQPLRLFAPRKGTIAEHRVEVATRVLERAHAEIACYLRWQAWCYDDGERRRVHLWGMVEVSVAGDGNDLQVRFLDSEPEAGRPLESADLTRPIGGYAFVFAFMPLLVRMSREGKLDPRALVGPTGDWMRDALRRAFRNLVDWRRLRRAVLAFLAPDPLIYALTRRVFEGSRAGIDDFNWVARHERELSLVALEHPRLLPFLQYTSGKEGALMPQLDRWLASAGLTPSARRKLERWGYGPFALVGEAEVFAEGVELIASYANLLDRLQVEDVPPEMFSRLAQVAKPSAPDWFHRALLAEVCRLSLDCPDDPYPPAFEDARAWLASNPSAPDANQARAGWAWIEAQAGKFRLAKDKSSRNPWTVPCEAFETGAHRVVPICTLADLHEEARLLRNCLDTYGDHCAFGRVGVFSIRALDGRRLACFALKRVAAPALWEIIQVAGPANTEASAELVDIAEAVLFRARYMSGAA